MERVLGQLAPSANALVELYVVPAAKSVLVTALVVCNRDSGAATFRVALAARGGVDDSRQYLYYDKSLAANDTLLLSLPGIVLQSRDVVRVRASTASLTFSLFGDEK